MKPALLWLLLASTHALRAPPRLHRIALRSEPEEAVPEVDTTAVEARSRALAASKLSVAAVVASAVQPRAGGAAARLVAGAGPWRPRRSRTAFATLADGDATRPLRAAAAHASAVYAACRAAGGLTRGALVATHALLVAAWPSDGPAAAWSERRGRADRQWAAIARACGRRGRAANATPLVLALAPWAGVGARCGRAESARAVENPPRASRRRRRFPGAW